MHSIINFAIFSIPTFCFLPWFSWDSYRSGRKTLLEFVPNSRKYLTDFLANFCIFFCQSCCFWALFLIIWSCGSLPWVLIVVRVHFWHSKYFCAMIRKSFEIWKKIAETTQSPFRKSQVTKSTSFLDTGLFNDSQNSSLTQLDIKDKNRFVKENRSVVLLRWTSVTFRRYRKYTLLKYERSKIPSVVLARFYHTIKSPRNLTWSKGQTCLNLPSRFLT